MPQIRPLNCVCKSRPLSPKKVRESVIINNDSFESFMYDISEGSNERQAYLAPITAQPLIRVPLVVKYQNKCDIERPRGKSCYKYNPVSDKGGSAHDKFILLQKKGNYQFTRRAYFENSYLVLERCLTPYKPIEVIKYDMPYIKCTIKSKCYQIIDTNTQALYEVPLEEGKCLEKYITTQNVHKEAEDNCNDQVTALEIEKYADTGDIILFQSNTVSAKLQRLLTRSEYGNHVIRPCGNYHQEFQRSNIFHRLKHQKWCVCCQMGKH